MLEKGIPSPDFSEEVSEQELHVIDKENNHDKEEKDAAFLEELINELEEGELVPEDQLLRATELGIDNIKAAEQALTELREYRDPIITVPKQYWDALHQAGKMEAHMTWDGTTAIRGRIDKPYAGHEDDERAAFKVLPHVKLHPRYTTRSRNDRPKFYGVFEVDMNNVPLHIGRDIVEIGAV